MTERAPVHGMASEIMWHLLPPTGCSKISEAMCWDLHPISYPPGAPAIQRLLIRKLYNYHPCSTGKIDSVVVLLTYNQFSHREILSQLALSSKILEQYFFYVPRVLLASTRSPFKCVQLPKFYLCNFNSLYQ